MKPFSSVCLFILAQPNPTNIGGGDTIFLSVEWEEGLVVLVELTAGSSSLPCNDLMVRTEC